MEEFITPRNRWLKKKYKYHARWHNDGFQNAMNYKTRVMISRKICRAD